MSFLIESSYNQIVSTCITFNKKEDGMNYFLNELSLFLNENLMNKTKEVILAEEYFTMKNEYISFSIKSEKEQVEVSLFLFEKLIYSYYQT